MSEQEGQEGGVIGEMADLMNRFARSKLVARAAIAYFALSALAVYGSKTDVVCDKNEAVSTCVADTVGDVLGGAFDTGMTTIDKITGKD